MAAPSCKGEPCQNMVHISSLDTSAFNLVPVSIKLRRPTSLSIAIKAPFLFLDKVPIAFMISLVTLYSCFKKTLKTDNMWAIFNCNSKGCKRFDQTFLNLKLQNSANKLFSRCTDEYGKSH